MVKGKSTWKYNKLLTGRRNYFNDGGQSSSSQMNVIKKLTSTPQQIPGVGAFDNLKPPSKINNPLSSTKTDLQKKSSL